MGRVLAIDYGERRLGLAMSDLSGALATGIDVVSGEKELWPVLDRLLSEETVDRVVVGLPLNMDGSVGPKAREVLAFKERLEAHVGIPVETWDERLTSVEAERRLRSSGASLAQRRRRVDRVAAQIILQSFLDCRRRQEGDDSET